jgi:hypothetical protein
LDQPKKATENKSEHFTKVRKEETGPNSNISVIAPTTGEFKKVSKPTPPKVEEKKPEPV